MECRVCLLTLPSFLFLFLTKNLKLISPSCHIKILFQSKHKKHFLKRVTKHHSYVQTGNIK
jgi:hypothetical protein